jgi:ABC-type uncharacterized transport system permease subunit
MLEHILTSFSITYTYFSSPIMCSTILNNFYSFFPIVYLVLSALPSPTNGMDMDSPTFPLHFYLKPYIWLDLQQKKIHSRTLYLLIQTSIGTNTLILIIQHIHTLMLLLIYPQTLYNIKNPSSHHSTKILT